VGVTVGVSESTGDGAGVSVADGVSGSGVRVAGSGVDVVGASVDSAVASGPVSASPAEEASVAPSVSPSLSFAVASACIEPGVARVGPRTVVPRTQATTTRTAIRALLPATLSLCMIRYALVTEGWRTHLPSVVDVGPPKAVVSYVKHDCIRPTWVDLIPERRNFATSSPRE
jgi:hypothetical protein